MSYNDDHFGEELCEELSLSLWTKNTPLDPSTKDFDLRPPTVNKDYSLVYKDRQYICIKNFLRFTNGQRIRNNVVRKSRPLCAAAANVRPPCLMILDTPARAGP